MLEIIKIRKLGKGVKYSHNFKELIVEHIITTMPITILAHVFTTTTIENN